MAMPESKEKLFREIVQELNDLTIEQRLLFILAAMDEDSLQAIVNCLRSIKQN